MAICEPKQGVSDSWDRYLKAVMPVERHVYLFRDVNGCLRAVTDGGFSLDEIEQIRDFLSGESTAAVLIFDDSVTVRTI